MNKYCLEVAGLKRYLPYVDINDELAFASFVVISDTELVSAAAPLLAEKIGRCDAIVTAEAKGIALAYEISKILGLKEFIVARKSEKSYMKDTLEVAVKSITTSSVQHLFLDGSDREKIKGREVCLLDRGPEPLYGLFRTAVIPSGRCRRACGQEHELHDRFGEE